MDEVTQYLNNLMDLIKAFVQNLIEQITVWFNSLIESIKNAQILEQITNLGTEVINFVFEYRMFFYVGIACFVVGYLFSMYKSKNEK